ncbi:hypothetical protein F2P79_008391, partial [Pimephales promelas]
MEKLREAIIVDHDYGTIALRDMSETSEHEIQEMEQSFDNLEDDHTPVSSPQAKKLRKRGAKAGDENANSFTQAIESVMKRFDGLDGKLENIEARMKNVQEALKKFEAIEVKIQNIEERTDAIKQATGENKENIEKLQRQVEFLATENKSLKEKVLEAARYKRRWNLRLFGLPEKEDEKIRDEVIGILTRVVPMSVDDLRRNVDTVHRLGIKGATNNNMPRPRTVKEDVWKMSRDARVCKEKKISFKKDFSKEDREAREKLWPRVDEARRRGKKAFLKEGYAIIDGKK